MRFLRHLRGLSSKIYVAFLITAAVPVLVAGLVGIYSSVEALKRETLHHLDREVSGRAGSLGRFFDQLTSELLFLMATPVVGDLTNSLSRPRGGEFPVLRERVERLYASFARTYPYIYQVRIIGMDGVEVVRVDRRDGRVHVVPVSDLQDKSGRYYVQEGLELEPGQVYVSALDLNVEHGGVEKPERPVIRFATPLADRAGVKRGLLVINLHADFMLRQIQEMAGRPGGVAYLFDRSGFFISRSSDAAGGDQGLRMQSAEVLAAAFTRPLLTTILQGGHGATVLGDRIVAYAPITIGRTLAERSDSSMEWVVASAYPRALLFDAVFNLYLLYGVLALCLVATAVAGFLLSRRLLGPLSQLSRETEEVAQGNFSRRVEIRGRDEIADLGARFNAMAARLEQSYRKLEEQKGRLEVEVQARTAQFARERENLAAVIESTADGIVAVDGEGRIALANRAAARLFGAPEGSLVDTQVRALWPGWDDYRAAARGDSKTSRRYELRRDDRTLAINAATVVSDGQRDGAILVARDVSEDRRLQEARRELDRQMFQMEKMTTMGELAMGLAHEIGNPLAGMKAVVQMLEEEERLAPHVRGYLGRIHGEVDRLSSFLRTFHGFAAPQETHPVRCDLMDVLEDVLLWTRKEARSRSVAIVYAACCREMPALWADPRQLKQVLLNLVINAVQAMPDGGRVEIGMCARAADLAADVPHMRFCVIDTGPGIPADVLPRIFDPFYTTRADGSGLGLAVVKKIAVQHGADIYVHSEPGKGTRFELVWPIALPDPSDAAPTLRRIAVSACPAEAIHA
jgi:PAS domain S-box-containing protein